MAGLVLIIAVLMILPETSGDSEVSAKSRRDNMKHFENPITLEFPLRGEWLAPNTPGTKVPSHGTDKFGETYAFDFLQVDWSRRGRPFYQTSFLEYLLIGVPLNKCYCWGKEVYAPCDGEIVKVEDGYPERQRVHVVTDGFLMLKNAMAYNPERDGVQAIAGNYIIMKCNGNSYALFAHLQTGSIAVSEGERVQKGRVMARVGHSGNSTAPHLHFQLMDSQNPLTAKGIPCVFEEYDLYQSDQWQTVYKTVPSDTDRIRFNR
jgi:hypothetical protein